VPSGPLIVMVVLGSSGLLSDSVGHTLFLLSFAWFFSSLIIVPALLFRADASPGSSGEDSGSGSGDPPEPPSPERGPGGIPLPDAEQSRERIRDHVRRKRRWLRRRTHREPQRTPSRL
jgi:hypothetical protein